MPVTVNQNMVDFVAGDDTIDGTITVSASVDPGSFIQEVAESLGFGTFDPNTTPTPDDDIATLRDIIIELWDDLIARNIEYVSGLEDATITINRVTNLPDGVGGSTYSTLHTPFPDDIDVYLPDADIMVNTRAWRTAVHEFGHALGLSHPGEYNASDDEDVITYATHRQFDEDTARYSIMSYFEPDADGSTAGWSKDQMLTPMIYDIMAIQQLYGANTTTRAEDTIYGFGGTADRAIFNFDPAAIGTFIPVMTIWDTDGHDTLDFSRYTVDQRIDLTPGSYSDVGTDMAGNRLSGNFGIAFGTWIEDVTAGTGNDTIIGNDLDNVLDGGAGADTISGGLGRDTLTGGAGDDILDGGGSADILNGGADNDTLRGDSGNDTLDGGIGDDTLEGGFGDDILLGGDGTDILRGGRGVDKLIGENGDDLLDGGGSSEEFNAFPDELTGGAGDDTFVYQRGYRATIISDFNWNSADSDVIDMRGTTANVFSFTDLLGRAVQVGPNVKFDFGDFNTLVLNGKTIDQLDPSQFRFSEEPESTPPAVEIYHNPDLFRPLHTDSAALLDGGFVTATVTIQTYYQQTIFGTRFDYRGADVGSFAVNSTPLNFGESHNQAPFMATLTDGRIVAAWKSEDGGHSVIRARLFSPDLQPLGDDFVVNSSPTYGISYFTVVTEVTAGANGGFAVYWQTADNPGTSFNVIGVGRGFDATGLPIGVDQLSGPISYVEQNFYAAIPLDEGRSVQVWQERLELSGPPYFGPGAVFGQITGEAPVKIIEAGFGWIDGSVIQLADGRIQFNWQGKNGATFQNYYTNTYSVILDHDLKGFTSHGTDGADTLKGGIYNDQLYGLEGNDTLIGGRGPDILDGGEGIDLADYDRSLEGVHIDMSDAAPETGGQANGDMLIGIENIRGSGYDDTIIGDYNDNRLDGSYGNDTINGGLGNDVIIGGKGNDTLDGGGGTDMVSGGAGNDLITLRGDDGTYGYGGDGFDEFEVLGNGLVALGEGGRDKFHVVGNNNSILAGTDAAGDTVRLEGDGNYVVGSLGRNQLVIDSGSNNTIIGGGGDDALFNVGTGDYNSLYGGEGSDDITGGSGIDYIWTEDYIPPSLHDVVDAGDGDDVVFSSGNGDELNGGLGTDSLILNLSWFSTGSSVTFGDPTGIAIFVGEGTAVANFENISLTLGIGRDTVIASGPDGNFVGTLTIMSGDGADTLVGGDGDDYLMGGWGDDLLTGGAGIDTFIYETGDGTDTITDFVIGTDKINLTSLWGKYQLSDLAISQVGANTVITLGSGIVLQNVQMSDLTAGDFIFASDPDEFGVFPTNTVTIDEDTVSTPIEIGVGPGDWFSYSFKEGFAPIQGEVSFSNGAFVYTPFADASGSDAFTFVVRYGESFAEQVVSVTINPINDAPMAPAESYISVSPGLPSGEYDTDAFDADDDTLTLAVKAGFEPASGTVTFSNGNFEYTPNANATGMDTFTIVISDGHGGTAEQVVYVTIDPGVVILGTAGDDTISTTRAPAGQPKATPNNDTIYGYAGNDSINGGAGIDTMYGGSGDDTYFVDNSFDQVNEAALEDGVDLVRSAASFALGDFVENLTLTGVEAIDGTGNDLANRIVGNSAANFLWGDDNGDALIGNAGDDILDGGAGDDALSGGDGADTLDGGAGSDRLNGGAGADTMAGGAADDVYTVDDVADVVVEDAPENGIDQVNASVSYILGANLENLRLTLLDAIDGTGNDLANRIIGNDGANVLTGGGENDVLVGNAGADTLYGDAGNDTLLGGDDADILIGGTGIDKLNGGLGADRMEGGAGDDVYTVDDVGDVVVEYGPGDGIDQVNASVSFSLGANLENLTLTLTGSTSGTGNSLANKIIGNAGANLLTGGDGNDTLSGRAGDDILHGDAGNDRLSGGTESDVLHGGLGNDILSGGDGNDFFVFDTTLNAATNLDRITDFVVGDDAIWLDAAVFAGLTAGDAEGHLSADQFHIGTSAVSANDHIIYDAAHGKLFYDADGLGGEAQIQFASITAHLALIESSFVIV